MGFVVKITSFLYRYLNGRDEKKSSKNRVTGGGDRVTELRGMLNPYGAIH